MKKAVRLLAVLLVLLAASAAPSAAILPICGEFCTCDSNCDWGCWDQATNTGTNCGDWGACSDHCGASRALAALPAVAALPAAAAPQAAAAAPAAAAPALCQQSASPLVGQPLLRPAKRSVPILCGSCSTPLC